VVMPIIPSPSARGTGQGRYRLQLEGTADARRDQMVAMVRQRREESERHYQSFRKKLPEWYDLWRGFTTGSWTPTKNNLWIPLIYSTIWSDVARKVATAFSKWPIVSFSGYGPDDMPESRKQEALVNAQLADADVMSKEIVTMLGADLYGSAISQVMWEHTEETRNRVDFQRMPLSGDMVRNMRQERVVIFDGPNYRNVDLLDAFPQPNFRELNGNQGMRWFIVRHYLDIDDCLYLASQAGGEVFSIREVNRLIREDGTVMPRSDEALSRRFDARTGITRSTGDKYSRPVELIEMWGRIPGEFASEFEGSTNVVITVANDRYLFRSVDTPFNHRQKPFIKFSPTPDPHYFFAAGKAEIAHQLQIAGNRFVNHQLDAADLLINPMWIYDKNKGINTRNLWARPGGFYGVEGNPNEALATVPMDFRSMQAGSEMTKTMWQFIQMGSGVAEDTIMGMDTGGSDRQTAREFMGRREASGTRLMLESVLYDSHYLEPLANMFTALNLQFLELPREVLLIGDSALHDRVTGEQIDGSRVEIDGSVLNRQYAAKANGTTMSLSGETRKANLLQLFQIVASAPPGMLASINMTNFLRSMMREFDIKNVNELIQEAPQMAQALEGQGQTAEGMPNDTQGMLQMIGGGGPSGPTAGVPA